MVKKKRKRRLKKSVKRGCIIIFTLPILLCLGYCFSKSVRFFNLSRPTESDSLSCDTTYLSELSQRINHLFRQPLRLDTNTIALEVFDIESGTTVFSRRSDCLVPPASCMKLLTATTALTILGIDHPYVVEVVGRGKQEGSIFNGDIVLQCDDDPVLESIEPLVRAIRQRGIQHVEGNIVLDLMRSDTLRTHPTAATWDIPYNRLPILLKGRRRIENDLRYFLNLQGITWTGRGFADADPLTRDDRPTVPIYHHETPLTEVLSPMLIHSSNIKADALFLHLEQVGNRIPALNISASRWLQLQALLITQQFGGDTNGFVINDGSGLSPDNRLSAHFLVQLLRYVWQHDDMRHLFIDKALATPGHPERHGSLLTRMSAPMYRNRIFVKTGTLTTRALSSLAGYAQTSDGRWLCFAVVNEDSPVAESRIFQDRLCRELVR